ARNGPAVAARPWISARMTCSACTCKREENWSLSSTRSQGICEGERASTDRWAIRGGRRGACNAEQLSHRIGEHRRQTVVHRNFAAENGHEGRGEACRQA